MVDFRRPGHICQWSIDIQAFLVVLLKTVKQVLNAGLCNATKTLLLFILLKANEQYVRKCDLLHNTEISNSDQLIHHNMEISDSEQHMQQNTELADSDLQVPCKYSEQGRLDPLRGDYSVEHLLWRT